MGLIEHPYRRLVPHVFSRLGGDGRGAGFVVRFYPYDACLVFFHGETAHAALDRAEKFRADVIDKNEAAYQKCMEMKGLKAAETETPENVIWD